MITNQFTNIDHQVFDEDLAFTLLESLPSSFHTFVVWLNTCNHQLSMELPCGQSLQDELRYKQKMQFNHGTKHETLTIKWEVQKGCRLEEVQNEK
jgi:hypothetical protein